MRRAWNRVTHWVHDEWVHMWVEAAHISHLVHDMVHAKVGVVVGAH